jgi:hypothetical protein
MVIVALFLISLVSVLSAPVKAQSKTIVVPDDYTKSMLYSKNLLIRLMQRGKVRIRGQTNIRLQYLESITAILRIK